MFVEERFHVMLCCFCVEISNKQNLFVVAVSVNGFIKIIKIKCCYSISFLGYWNSHSGDFCSLWTEASHYNRQCSFKEEKKYLVWYNRADRKECCWALVGIYTFIGNHYISYFFKRDKDKMLEDSWVISKIFHLLQNVRYQPRTTWASL